MSSAFFVTRSLESRPKITMMIAALALAWTPALQDLRVLEKDIQRAVNTDTIDAGTRSARTLADIRSPEAMLLRFEMFEEKRDSWHGVHLRDWFYSGMIRATTDKEGTLLARQAANKKADPLLRLCCLRAIERSTAPVPAKELDSRSLRSAKSEEIQLAWELAAGTALAQGRVTGDAGRLRERLAEATGVGLALLSSWSEKEKTWLFEQAVSSRVSNSARSLLLRTLFAREFMTEEELLPFIEAALDSSSPELLAAGLATTLRPVKISVPALIGLLEKEKDQPSRWQWDAAENLRAITGMEFGSDPDTWHRWWNGAGKAWLKDGPSKDPQRQSGRPQKSEDTVATVFNVPIHSLNLVLIVDGSGSMTHELGPGSRAEAAIRELGVLLAGLPEKARFDILIAGNQVTSAFGEQVPNRKRAREEAFTMLNRCDFRERSCLHDALLEAMRRSGADTIVLIGDGGSTEGIHQFSGHILDGIRREFALRGTRIHTIGLGAEKAGRKTLMRDLASSTGGIMLLPTE